MKKYFPDMVKRATVFCAKIEEKIKDFNNDEFDLVFTIAVLMHIHPKSEWVFDDMVRITRRYLITIEDESGVATRNFPRNYKQVFESKGLKEIYFIDEVPGLPDGYVMRIFSK